MEHQGTAVLSSPRLLLRPFRAEDAEAVHRNWATDEAMTRRLSWQAHKTPKETEDMLRRWIKRYEQPDFYHWAIVSRESGEPIGMIGVVAFDPRTNTAEIGYCVGSPWWNRGYVSEAFRTVMGYLFDEVKISRLEARHDTRNPASGAVMKKCGLQFEGILRRAGRNNLGVADVAVYSMLPEEYAEQKA